MFVIEEEKSFKREIDWDLVFIEYKKLKVNLLKLSLIYNIYL